MHIEKTLIIFFIINQFIGSQEAKAFLSRSRKFSLDAISLSENKKIIRFCIDVCIECFQTKDSHDSHLDTNVLEINPEIRCLKVFKVDYYLIRDV